VKPGHRGVVVDVAHGADERRHRTHPGIAGPEPGDLGTDVEVRGLDAHGHRTLLAVRAPGSIVSRRSRGKEGHLVAVPESVGGLAIA